MREPRFWYPARHRGTPLSARLLAPAGFIYGLAGRLRQHRATPSRAGVPVICIGNITAGGAGKTPLALSLASRLIEAGEKVQFLTRGYGGREPGPIRVDPLHHDAAAIGDEPLLLAAMAPVWVARDRVKGAAAAIRSGAGLLVMDDGFQNPHLHKDFSILVVDAAMGSGNGRLLPAGPLREKVDDALSRANALVITGHGHAADGIAARARARGIPVFRSIIRPVAAPEGAGPWLAFAGIGRPEKFFRTLSDMRLDVAETVSFPDHHSFSENDALRLLMKARDIGASLITTEKDAARMARAREGTSLARLADATISLPVRALVDDMDTLMSLIHEAVKRARRA